MKYCNAICAMKIVQRYLCNESPNFLDIVRSKCIVPIPSTRACGGVIDSNETLFVLVDNFLVILMINQLFPGDSSLGLLLSNILLKRNFLRQIISVVWIID